MILFGKLPGSAIPAKAFVDETGTGRERSMGLDRQAESVPGL